ncbi:unnamed protein product [Rhizoctonia solani]|uniref:Uncharacterized protein n=1 Tax=Rhizoctonia solani TaxID=456999 RepID=A0A8H3CZK4_9AGAM|nr:unnamed protein product [Rhizoctonia solani]
MASPAPTNPIRKGANVNLMRVYRQLFYDILPFVWEEVDQATPLVSMIPGWGIVTYDSDFSPYVVSDQGPMLYDLLKRPLPGHAIPYSSLDLTRFNIYAPHVKQLTPSTLHVDEYDGWEGFLSCTRSVDLLPNLETLILPDPDDTRRTSNNETIEADAVNWITAFLPTSLQMLVLASREVIPLAPNTP